MFSLWSFADIAVFQVSRPHLHRKIFSISWSEFDRPLVQVTDSSFFELPFRIGAAKGRGVISWSGETHPTILSLSLWLAVCERFCLVQCVVRFRLDNKSVTVIYPANLNAAKETTDHSEQLADCSALWKGIANYMSTSGSVIHRRSSKFVAIIPDNDVASTLD